MRVKNQVLDFSGSVLKWTTRAQKEFLGVRTLSLETKAFLRGHVERLVAAYSSEPELYLFLKDGRLAGFVGFADHLYPRIKKQKSVDFAYDHRYRAEFFKWAKPIFARLIESAPKGTSLGFSPRDEKFFKPLLAAAKGYHRSDILIGNVDTALKELKRKKNPPDSLDHLGLELRVIESKRELPEMMKLQKKVSIQNREHTYFSHTREQLESDQKSYESILKSKQGLILGVRERGKLKGVMVTTVLPPAAGPSSAGMSFFLDRSIQGRGVVTVGYRVLLEYLKQRKIKNFVGGTSQAAVRGLGKIMKRDCRYINVVRMSK